MGKLWCSVQERLSSNKNTSRAPFYNCTAKGKKNMIRWARAMPGPIVSIMQILFPKRVSTGDNMLLSNEDNIGIVEILFLEPSLKLTFGFLFCL